MILLSPFLFKDIFKDSLELEKSLARQSVHLLITAADRLEKVRDCFTLPATLLVQSKLEETDEV